MKTLKNSHNRITTRGGYSLAQTKRAYALRKQSERQRSQQIRSFFPIKK